MALVHPNDVVPGEVEPHIESIYTTQNLEEVGGTLVRAQLMDDYVISSYPTHGKCHPPFFEGDHGNDHLLLILMGKHLI